MPDIPLIIREASSCSGTYRVHMSEEEKIASQESLKAYCKPTEFYKTLQHRAIKNPLFLQRCLNYKIEAKHQRRIQMTVSLSDIIDAAGVQTHQKPFPLYIMLARLVSPKPTAEYSAVYKFSRTCILTGVDGVSQGQAKFLLPGMEKLALEAKPGSLAILFISFAGGHSSQSGIDSSKIHSGNIEGHCLWSKIPLELLHSLWKKYPMDLGQKVDSVSLVGMQPCFINLKSMTEEKCVKVFKVPSNPLTSSSPQQMKVTISAEEVGPTEKSPYTYSFSFNDILSPSVLQILRLREGNVIFNYRYYNNKLEKTEVTEDFTCPICLVKCASFKGLQCHMPSTHDLFNFEFWINEEYQIVNVSLKSETMNTEINEDDVNEKMEPYFFSTKKSRRKRQKSQVGNSRQGPHLGLAREVTDDNFGLFRLSNCKCPSSSESHT